jgi:hypothetical protein
VSRSQLALTNRSAKRRPTWQNKFISALTEVPSVKHACAAAGINRTTAYTCRKADPEFAQRWSDAIGHSIDQLEEKVFAAALHGGEHNAAEISLWQWLLRCHKPEVYRETNRVEVDQRLYGVLLLPEKELLPP